jgi:hypothetical protein
MKSLDDFYLQQEEPIKGCLLALGEMILSQDKEVTNSLKYGMPCFCYKGKMFCYLWVDKKYKQPYILLVEGERLDEPELITENRSLMKIMVFDPSEDLPKDRIERILQKALSFYKSGEIKTK